jgi:hypothetical protein
MINDMSTLIVQLILLAGIILPPPGFIERVTVRFGQPELKGGAFPMSVASR